MMPTELLLGLAGLAAGAALVSHALHEGRWQRVTEFFTRAHAALVLGALLLLVVSFLAADLSYEYVWDHTRADYPFHYRLAGVWGGEEGTVLLWAGGVSALLLLVLRKGDGEAGLHRRAALLLMGFSACLAMVALLPGGLGETPEDRLLVAPQGRGLADVLLTPLMVIHPPVQFAAYALFAPVAAYVAASWLGRPGKSADAWAGPAFQWARWAWLFATLGLGLGALWAYYVLSFGGYWAWDPVETANLLPWLALTAFLHAGKGFLRHRDHPLAAPLLAFGAFTLTLFATFATRSGLWVSVHAFTDPTDRFEPDAPLRLLGIVGAHEPTRLFLGLLSGIVAAGLALFLLHHARPLRPPARHHLQAHAVVLLTWGGMAAADPAFAWSILFRAASLLPGGMTAGMAIVTGILLGLPLGALYLAREETHARHRALDARTLLGGAVALLALAAGVTFLLNLQVVNRPDRLLFDRRAPFLALPLVALLTLTLGLAPLGRRGAFLLAGLGVAGGVAGAILFPDHRVLAMSAPLLAAAALAAFLRLAHSQGRGAPTRLRAAGLALLLASVLGLAFWSNPPTRILGHDIADGTSLALGIVGFALSAVAFAGALAALRGKGRRVATAGAMCGSLALGYGLGGLLGMAALALVLRERGSFGPLDWRQERARVREAGTWLLHLSVILGLLGYAASTYSQQSATLTAVPLDGAATLGDTEFHLEGARAAAVADAEGLLLSLTIPLHVERAGRSAGESEVRFEWQGDRYKGVLDVDRHLSRDVYVTPLAFHTPEGWVGADAAGSGRVGAQGVDMVTFRIALLPLVGLVWTGLWVGLLGMAFILAATAREKPVRVVVEEGPARVAARR